MMLSIHTAVLSHGRALILLVCLQFSLMITFLTYLTMIASGYFEQHVADNSLLLGDPAQRFLHGKKL